jgi:flavin reductase (DIM6/NTAB) family NADH-FMN oxidoreductase RutF
VTFEPAPTGARVAGVAAVSDFVDAMSGLASGVALATTWLDGRPWGTTITAFASVSLAPPTVLVSLGSETTSARVIDARGGFGVSILARHQWPLARRGATNGAPKFFDALVDASAPPGPSPAVAGALAHLDCELVERVEVGDHTVFFGRVRSAVAAPQGDPLVYYRRGYRTLAAAASPPTDRSASWRSS